MVKNQSILIMLFVILSSQIMLGGGGGGYKGEQFASDPHWIGTHSRCVQSLIQRKQDKIEQLRKTPGNEKQILKLQQEVSELSECGYERACEAVKKGQRLDKEFLHTPGAQKLYNVAQALETAPGQIAIVEAVRNFTGYPGSKKAQKAVQESVKKINKTQE